MNYTPEYKKTIDNLKKQVGNYSTFNKTIPTFSFIKKLTNPIYVYISIPVIVFILFVICRPNCILIEVDGTKKQKLSLKKLLISTVLIAGVIIIGFYIYFKKNKLNPSKI